MPTQHVYFPPSLISNILPYLQNLSIKKLTLQYDKHWEVPSSFVILMVSFSVGAFNQLFPPLSLALLLKPTFLQVQLNNRQSPPTCNVSWGTFSHSPFPLAFLHGLLICQSKSYKKNFLAGTFSHPNLLSLPMASLILQGSNNNLPFQILLTSSFVITFKTSTISPTLPRTSSASPPNRSNVSFFPKWIRWWV